MTREEKILLGRSSKKVFPDCEEEQKKKIILISFNESLAWLSTDV